MLSGRGWKPTSPALCYDGVQQNGKDQVYKVNYSLLLLSLQPLNRKRLHDLVREVDPNQTLDEDAEEVRRGWEDCRIYHYFYLLVIDAVS